MGGQAIRFFAPMFALAVAHFCVALSIGERPLTSYFTLTWMAEVFSILLLPLFLWIIYTTWQALREGAASPLAFLVERVRAERHRFYGAFAILLCFALVNRSYRAIKVAIPRLEPFYADPLFAQWDKALFGVDPWRITHALIGPLGTEFVDTAYFLWFKIVHLTFAFAAFSKDRSFQMQACLSYFLIWIILGNILAITMSAAGPCYYEHFYGDDRFRPLTDLLAERGTIAAILQEYLLSASGDEAIGSGISAMPSLHCALTMFIVLVVWKKFGPGWQFALAVAYHFVILIGSVHLGWHYAVDGLLSSVLVPPLWWAVGRLVSAVEGPRQPIASVLPKPA